MTKEEQDTWVKHIGDVGRILEHAAKSLKHSRGNFQRRQGLQLLERIGLRLNDQFLYEIGINSTSYDGRFKKG